MAEEAGIIVALNHLFILLGIESWKPVLTALVLPPVPFLVLTLIGARLILPRRGWGWALVMASVALLWLSSCSGMAQWLASSAAPAIPALTPERIAAIRAEVRPNSPLASVAIVILGGGMEPYAPEYGLSNLDIHSLERLRYGVWLGRQTGAPLAFSGGTGWSQRAETSEAQIAARVAAQEFGRPLRWVEDESRDTRENAGRSIALLKPAGIRHIVLVTHASHMPRALRAFEEAAGDAVRIEPAPMGLARNTDSTLLQWLPSSRGFNDVRNLAREALGRLMGA